MRSILRNLAINILAVGAKPARGVHILNGHYLSRKEWNRPEVFESQLRDIRNSCEFLSIQQAAELVVSGQAGEFDGVGVAFTFDDGFSDCYYSLAPALDRFNTNACFFINPGFIDSDEEYRRNFTENVVLTSGKVPMTWAQVVDLDRRGFVIGNHTLDHVRLNITDIGRLDEQIFTSKSRIEGQIGKAVEYFAWPFGQFSDMSDDALRLVLRHHKYAFSGAGYTKYTSYEGRVINRRHFEADWKVSHLMYFLSKGKAY